MANLCLLEKPPPPPCAGEGGGSRSRPALARREGAGGVSWPAAGKAGLLALLPAAVPLEDPGRRELTQLVPDHVFRHVQPHELPPVVDQEGRAHELRHDRAVARPRPDRLAVLPLP